MEITLTPEQQALVTAHVPDAEQVCVDALLDAVERNIAREHHEAGNRAAREALDPVRDAFPRPGAAAGR